MIVIANNNPADIAATVMKFRNLTSSKLAEMGKNGKSFYDRELAMAVAVKKFEKVFEDVINDSLSVQF